MKQARDNKQVRHWKFKIELAKMVVYLNTVFDYPDATERRNDIQQYIDSVVREVISEYYQE